MAEARKMLIAVNSHYPRFRAVREIGPDVLLNDDQLTDASNDNFMKQSVAITFELEETVVLKQGGKIVVAFCPRCQTEVDMISPDVLALLAGSREREIFRLIESGSIHFIEHGRVLACASCYRMEFTKKEPAVEAVMQAVEANKE